MKHEIYESKTDKLSRKQKKTTNVADLWFLMPYTLIFSFRSRFILSLPLTKIRPNMLIMTYTSTFNTLSDFLPHTSRWRPRPSEGRILETFANMSLLVHSTKCISYLLRLNGNAIKIFFLNCTQYARPKKVVCSTQVEIKATYAVHKRQGVSPYKTKKLNV